MRANQAWDIILLRWFYAAVISEHTEVQKLQWEQSGPSRWEGLISESVLMEPLQQEAGTDLCIYLTLSNEQKVSSYLCMIQAIYSGSVACLDSASTPVFVAQENSYVAFHATSQNSIMWKYLKEERNCSNFNFFAKALLEKSNLQSSRLLFQ